METIQKTIAQGHSPLTGYQPENYDEVELTETEKEQALREARKQKQASLKKAEYFKSLSEDEQLISFSAQQFSDYVFKRIQSEVPGFTVDDENTDVWTKLVLYFSADPEFEKLGEGYSLQKGIYLYGNTGCGKTVLMRGFRMNPLRCYNQVSARHISERFASIDKKTGGFNVIEKYSREEEPNYETKRFSSNRLGLFIDDVGTEELAANYANKLDVIAQILLNRYDNRLPRNATHITTNLTVEAMEKSYGVRVRSRMKEMFNLVEFPTSAKDRRS